MKLPTSLTTVTPLSKLLALVTFVVFICAFFFLGIQYERSRSIESTNSSYLATTKAPVDDCAEMKLTGSNSYNNKWEGSLRSAHNTVYYVETNPETKTICEYKIYPQQDNQNITHDFQGLNLTSGNLYHASFLDVYQNNESGTNGGDFITIDIPSRNLLSKIAVGNYPDFYIDRFQESYSIIRPITFIGGCSEDPGSCEALSQASTEDWKRDDVLVTIVRIDGKSVSVPRNTLPHKNFGYSYDYDDRNFVIRAENTTYDNLLMVNDADFKIQ